MNRATYAPVERRRCDGLRQIPVDDQTRPTADVVASVRAAVERHKSRLNRLEQMAGFRTTERRRLPAVT